MRHLYEAARQAAQDARLVVLGVFGAGKPDPAVKRKITADVFVTLAYRDEYMDDGMPKHRHISSAHLNARIANKVRTMLPQLADEAIAELEADHDRYALAVEDDLRAELAHIAALKKDKPE
jgi:hypothetical protein